MAVLKWERIETAPVGELILVAGGGLSTRVGYKDAAGQWRGVSGLARSSPPKWWMPLPRPPKEE